MVLIVYRISSNLKVDYIYPDNSLQCLDNAIFPNGLIFPNFGLLLDFLGWKLAQERIDKIMHIQIGV